MTDILVVDFETYYDSAYSLSKITTEEYLRHELFDTIGVAVKRNDEPAVWFSGPKVHTKKWLDQWDWDNSVGVAHNAMFDMAILNWHYDIRPKRIMDTLSMLRAIDGPDAGNSLAKAAERYGLGAKGTEVIKALNKGRLDFATDELAAYGEYCCNDVELTHGLLGALAPLLPASELQLIDLTVRMFTEPVLRLDPEVLTTHLKDVKRKKAELLDKVCDGYDVSEMRNTLMSNARLAQLLDAAGVAPPMKTSPATGKQTYAFGKTDAGFTALMEHPNPAIQAIVAARLGVKSTLEETRTSRFLDISERGGAFPVPLRYYAAHTGRFGGDDKVNLQNLPRNSPLKSAIVAPDGHVLVDCDSSQIEARTLAWLAGQEDLVDAFEVGEDVYKIMASAIYGVPPEEVTKDQRFIGKTTILGSGYGMGPVRFREQLRASGVTLALEECRHIIHVYRETYSHIPKLWKQAQKALVALSTQRSAPLGREGVLQVDLFGIRLPNGLYIRYPNLRVADKVSSISQFAVEYVYDTKKGRSTIPTRIFGAKIIENVCQALARIVVCEQMLMISRRYKVALTVHDSVVAVVPEAEAREGKKFVEDCMRMRPKWASTLPLNCESKIGATYG